MDNATFVRELSRFIELARRGGHAGASGGEVKAFKLATAILEYAPGLDQEALDGAAAFIKAAAYAYFQMDQLVNGHNGRRVP